MKHFITRGKLLCLFLVYGMGEYKPRNNCKRMAPEFRDTPPVFLFQDRGERAFRTWSWMRDWKLLTDEIFLVMKAFP